MKKMSKKERLLALIIALVTILVVIVIVVIVNNKKEKSLTCTSLTNDITITFKGNKASYVKGSMIVPKDISDEQKEMIQQNISQYQSVMMYFDGKVKYAFNFSEENTGALNYIGLNLNDSIKYKDVRNYLEISNYKCD